jgi:hypothetical protein
VPAVLSRRVSRRGLIQATGAVGLSTLLGACTDSPRTGAPDTPATSLPRHGDAALVAAALADEKRLLSYCRSVIARHPPLAGLVVEVQERQHAHVDALQSTLRGIEPPAFQRRSPVPAGARSATAKLVKLAAAARRDRLADCLAAESGLLARLFASASASHAVTVDLLEAGS